MLVGSSNFNEGNNFNIDGFTWTIDEVYDLEGVEIISLDPFKTKAVTLWFVKLEREEHVEVWFDYWHLFDYSFFNWNFLREVRRASTL